MRIVRAVIDHPGLKQTIDLAGDKVGSRQNRAGNRNAVAKLEDGSLVHLHDKGWRNVTSVAGKDLYVVQLHRFRKSWIMPFPGSNEAIYGILDDQPPKYGKLPEIIAWCRASSYEMQLMMIAAKQNFNNQELIASLIIGLICYPSLNLSVWKGTMEKAGCSKRFVAAVLDHYYVGMPASEVNETFAPSAPS